MHSMHSLYRGQQVQRRTMHNNCSGQLSPPAIHWLPSWELSMSAAQGKTLEEIEALWAPADGGKSEA